MDILLSLLGPVHLTDGLVVNCAEGFYSVQTTPGLSSSCLLISCIEHGSVDPVAEVYFWECYGQTVWVGFLTTGLCNRVSVSLVFTLDNSPLYFISIKSDIWTLRS